VAVDGWPSDTRLFGSLAITATVLGGSYHNVFVQFVKMRWGRVTSYSLYEDSLKFWRTARRWPPTALQQRPRSLFSTETPTASPGQSLEIAVAIRLQPGDHVGGQPDMGVLGLDAFDQLGHVDQLAVVSRLGQQPGSEADQLVIPANLPPSRRRPVSLDGIVESRQAVALRQQAEPTRRLPRSAA
jgi:hypothetical protein